MADPLIQPRGRNWRSLGVVVMAGALVICVGVILALTLGRKEKIQHKEEPRPAAVQDQLNVPKFSTGYPLPPQPVTPPAPVTPASLPPAPAPTPYVPPASPAKAALRPMGSMFLTEADAAAIQAEEEAQAAQTGQAGKPKQPSGNRGLTSKAGKWLAEAGTGGDDFVGAPYLPPMGQYIIQAGTIITATLVNQVNSDLPGDAVAIINDDVRDTPTGDTVLIPAGSKLYGTYSDDLEYAQSRAQISWSRILFPNGYSQSVGSMAGTDAGGAAGVEGEVDRHPWSMVGAIAGAALLSIVGQTGQIITGGSGGTGTVNIGQIGAQGAGQQAESIGGKIVDKELSRKNTLRLMPGTQVAVLLNRDIVTLTPYQTVSK